jgi:hypothetical protein
MRYMEVKPRGRPGAVLKGLIDEGIIGAMPKETPRELQYADGVDIVFNLRGLGPEYFDYYSEKLLALVEQECERYPNPPGAYPPPYQYFAYFTIRLNQAGRKKGINRTYTASRTDDISQLISGVEQPPTGETMKPTDLGAIVDRIKKLSGEYKPGVFLQQQRPYRVTQLGICIRAGIHERKLEIMDEMARKRAEMDAEADLKHIEEGEEG